MNIFSTYLNDGNGMLWLTVLCFATLIKCLIFFRNTAVIYGFQSCYWDNLNSSRSLNIRFLSLILCFQNHGPLRIERAQIVYFGIITYVVVVPNPFISMRLERDILRHLSLMKIYRWYCVVLKNRDFMFTEVKGIHLSAVVLVHRILLFLHHFTYPGYDIRSF